MFRRVLIVFVCFMCGVSGSGIFHENSKITFNPDIVQKSKYFGYSVLLNPYGLIVGAPKAMNRNSYPYDWSSGQIFNCTLKELVKKNITCYPVKSIGLAGNFPAYYEYTKLVPHNFFRDDMWFGATIGALTDGKILICAPRHTVKSDGTLLANGVCYFHQKRMDFAVYPLKDTSRISFRADGLREEYGKKGQDLRFYEYGQVGMSMKVTDNNHVIIGAPGLLQWAGGIVSFLYTQDDDTTYFIPRAITNPYYTKDLGPDDYFGYSVESGVFKVNGSTMYVGGAPRSKIGYGQVLIFTPAKREMDPLDVRAKLQGPQLGAYFGASLCCLDIDGDGAADLLVGAPNYVKKDGSLPYDQGAVFIYMTKQMDSNFILEASGSVSGSGESGARFGTTIADLGDVDGDGFKDVAIAAPWEDEGTGVVYIYRGYAKGLRSKYNQRIFAEGAASFGISMSKGFDVDSNNCNDLAIGAAISTTVYIYRCIPTVIVHTSIKVPDAMNLPHNATNFTALFCVTLHKKPMWPLARMDFRAKITIDPESNRAMIVGDAEYQITVTPGDERCDEQTVEIKPSADLSKPFYMQLELEPIKMPSETLNFDYTAARVSEESNLESTVLIQLMRDCGEDMICTPWLVMTLDPLDNPFIPGTDSKLGTRLTILNKEEPAYGARVNISLPMIPKRVPSPCSLKDLIMICDVPAPLLRDEEIVWDIELEFNLNSSTEVNLKVVAELEDSLYYRNISKDLVVDLVLDVTPEASFNVTGKPLPNSTFTVSREKLYNAENLYFLNHVQITNLGPSDWYNLEVHIFFDMVNLFRPIQGCENKETKIVCLWSVPAKVSFHVVLMLRFDLNRYGEILKTNSVLNTTTTILLFWKDKPGHKSYTNTSITTTFVLESAPPIWPLVLGIIAGLVFGLLLLSLIVFLFHKFGFFSRYESLKEFQEQNASSVVQLEASEGASSAAATKSGSIDSTGELLFDDSD